MSETRHAIKRAASDKAATRWIADAVTFKVLRADGASTVHVWDEARQIRLKTATRRFKPDRQVQSAQFLQDCESVENHQCVGLGRREPRLDAFDGVAAAASKAAFGGARLMSVHGLVFARP